MPATHFIAADIGNARIKLGLFAGDCAGGLPEPLRTLPLVGNEPELDAIGPWLASDVGCVLARTAAAPPYLPPEGACEHAPYQWWIASVNRRAASRLIDWLAEHRPTDRVTLLASGDLPLEVRVPRPDMVGIDRLVDAVAVNRLRHAGRSAVIVDVGSAITVDLLSADGAFLGGAILPGIEMSARALHKFTDMLPLVSTSELTAPPSALGTATISAMRAGLFWGAVGAIRQLIEQLGKATSGDDRPPSWGGSLTAAPTDGPEVFLTGGAGAVVAELLAPAVRHVPNLTLAGIALAATPW
jgi:type III pantothenate kinase